MIPKNEQITSIIALIVVLYLGLVAALYFISSFFYEFTSIQSSVTHLRDVVEFLANIVAPIAIIIAIFSLYYANIIFIAQSKNALSYRVIDYRDKINNKVYIILVEYINILDIIKLLHNPCSNPEFHKQIELNHLHTNDIMSLLDEQSDSYKNEIDFASLSHQNPFFNAHCEFELAVPNDDQRRDFKAAYDKLNKHFDDASLLSLKSNPDLLGISDVKAADIDACQSHFTSSQIYLKKILDQTSIIFARIYGRDVD